MYIYIYIYIYNDYNQKTRTFKLKLYNRQIPNNKGIWEWKITILQEQRGFIES